MTGPGGIWGLAEARAATSPSGRFAIDETDREVTFAELVGRAEVMAAGLAGLGVGPGVVVSWQLPNRVDAAVLALALCRLGATQNPVVAILRRREVGFICAQADSAVLVVSEAVRGFDFPAMAADIAAGTGRPRVVVAGPDLAGGPLDGDRDGAGPPAPPGPWYFYTSGTTADPKGARHSDASLVAAARGFTSALRITAADRLSMVIPLTHVGGIVHLIASLDTGCSLVFCEVFDPAVTPGQLRRQGATLLPGAVPFVNAYLSYAAAHPEADPLFPAGRVMLHGGSPKPARLHYEVKERFATAGVVSGYGMTECPMLAWSTPDDDDEDIATTEGRAVPGVEIRVTGPDGLPVAADEEGEVRVRGPQLMAGYVDASLDADAFDADGFFRSGDLGRLDARGTLRITGRLKDVIIRNMENVSATEVESLLHDHPGVAEVAVIGVPDERTGERVCAVVVPAAGVDPPTLAGLCEHLRAAGLSTRKLPERLEIVEGLPRNAMEKVVKASLRARFGGG